MIFSFSNQVLLYSRNCYLPLGCPFAEQSIVLTFSFRLSAERQVDSDCFVRRLDERYKRDKNSKSQNENPYS